MEPNDHNLWSIRLGEKRRLLLEDAQPLRKGREAACYSQALLSVDGLNPARVDM